MPREEVWLTREALIAFANENNVPQRTAAKLWLSLGEVQKRLKDEKRPLLVVETIAKPHRLWTPDLQLTSAEMREGVRVSLSSLRAARPYLQPRPRSRYQTKGHELLMLWLDAQS